MEDVHAIFDLVELVLHSVPLATLRIGGGMSLPLDLTSAVSLHQVGLAELGV